MKAHELARGEKVLIAVIDSGIDTTHPELEAAIAETFDALGSGDKLHVHGTAVAGSIVARGTLLGVAPAARILGARAFGGSDGTSFSVVVSLNWAVGRGAQVINMSFAGPRDPLLARAIGAAHEKGVVMVAAAGNAGEKSPPLFPAADARVIAVTATDQDDNLYQRANRGGHIAVAAPGVDLLLPALHATTRRIPALRSLHRKSAVSSRY